MSTRRTLIRKSDLSPAFEAAKAAGFDEVRVEVETPEGLRFLITAGVSGADKADEQTPLEKWRAGRAAS